MRGTFYLLVLFAFVAPSLLEAIESRTADTASANTTTNDALKSNPKARAKKEGKQNIPFPSCSCVKGICNCCTGNLLQYLRQKACLNVRYIPEDFAFNLAMVINSNVIYETRLSGKNPPPICIGIPRVNQMKMCAKIYNVYYSGSNVHFCVNMEGKWQSSVLFSTAFDCVRMGTQGVALVKPEDGGGLPDVALVTSTIDADVDTGGEDIIEEYDENLLKSIFEDIMDI